MPRRAERCQAHVRAPSRDTSEPFRAPFMNPNKAGTLPEGKIRVSDSPIFAGKSLKSAIVAFASADHFVGLRRACFRQLGGVVFSLGAAGARTRQGALLRGAVVVFVVDLARAACVLSAAAALCPREHCPRKCELARCPAPARVSRWIYLLSALLLRPSATALRSRRRLISDLWFGALRARRPLVQWRSRPLCRYISIGSD